MNYSQFGTHFSQIPNAHFAQESDYKNHISTLPSSSQPNMVNDIVTNMCKQSEEMNAQPKYQRVTADLTDLSASKYTDFMVNTHYASQQSQPIKEPAFQTTFGSHFLDGSPEKTHGTSAFPQQREHNAENTWQANDHCDVNSYPAAEISNKKRKKAPKQNGLDVARKNFMRIIAGSDGNCLYGCPECPVSYASTSLLEQHVSEHFPERRFFCDICGACLRRKDHLTRHKQSHNSDRPHPCTVCLKTFKRKEQLALHHLTHSGEKKHACEVCGKAFYRKDHLMKHNRSHFNHLRSLNEAGL